MRQKWGASEKECNQCTLKQIPAHSQHWTPSSFVKSPKSSPLCLYDDCKKNCVINYLVWRCKQALQCKKNFQRRIKLKTHRVLLNDKVKTPRLKNFKEKVTPFDLPKGCKVRCVLVNYAQNTSTKACWTEGNGWIMYLYSGASCFYLRFMFSSLLQISVCLINTTKF
jgi:hypothetical protein